MYDEANRLVEVREISSTDYPFVAATYSYSALGQMVAITRAGGSGVAATGVISAFSYDKLNRTPTSRDTGTGVMFPQSPRG